MGAGGDCRQPALRPFRARPGGNAAAAGLDDSRARARFAYSDGVINMRNNMNQEHGNSVLPTSAQGRSPESPAGSSRSARSQRSLLLERDLRLRNDKYAD